MLPHSGGRNLPLPERLSFFKGKEGARATKNSLADAVVRCLRTALQGREQNQGASAGRRLTSRSVGVGFFDVRETVPILCLPVGFAATGGHMHLACVGADAFERVGMNRGRFCRMAEDGGQPGATRKGAMPDEVERCRQVELAQAVAVGQAAGGMTSQPSRMCSSLSDAGR